MVWTITLFSPFGVCVWGGAAILEAQDTVYHSLCHAPTSCGIFKNQVFFLKNNVLHLFLCVNAYIVAHVSRWRGQLSGLRSLFPATVPSSTDLPLGLQPWKQAPLPTGQLHQPCSVLLLTPRASLMETTLLYVTYYRKMMHFPIELWISFEKQNKTKFGVSLCSVASLELRDLPVSASWILGLKVCATMAAITPFYGIYVLEGTLFPNIFGKQ